MVFVWGRGWGPRRRRGWGPRGPGFGGYRGYGPPGYGPRGYGYGYRRGYGGGGSCLRDLFFLETGCCLADLLGCGPQLLLVAPALFGSARGARGSARDRMIAAIGVYQREISPRRPPSCRFTPTCSAYAAEAIHRHGARRGAWLALRRLLRCRPGAARRPDPVPAA